MPVWWPSMQWWPRTEYADRHPHRGRKRAWTLWCPRRGSAAGAARPCEHDGGRHRAHRFQRTGGEVSSCKPLGPRQFWPHPLILWSLRAARQAVISALREQDLFSGSCQTLDELLPEVLAEVKPYRGAVRPQTSRCFVAGGVYTGADLAHFTQTGCRRRSACHPLYHHLRMRCIPGVQGAFC